MLDRQRDNQVLVPRYGSARNRIIQRIDRPCDAILLNTRSFLWRR